MRITGWCEKCHRVRPVQVGSAGMVAMTRGGFPTGTCVTCDEKERTARENHPRPAPQDLPAWIKPGTRFRLVNMGVDDPDPVPGGSTGMVDSIVNMGDSFHLNVTWDPEVRRSLNLAWPTDRIEPDR